jgi:hypothetical protein
MGHVASTRGGPCRATQAWAMIRYERAPSSAPARLPAVGESGGPEPLPRLPQSGVQGTSARGGRRARGSAGGRTGSCWRNTATSRRCPAARGPDAPVGHAARTRSTTRHRDRTRGDGCAARRPRAPQGWAGSECPNPAGFHASRRSCRDTTSHHRTLWTPHKSDHLRSPRRRYCRIPDPSMSRAETRAHGCAGTVAQTCPRHTRGPGRGSPAGAAVSGEREDGLTAVATRVVAVVVMMVVMVMPVVSRRAWPDSLVGAGRSRRH